MEKLLQNEISNEDKLVIINKYLSDTVNIIENQINPLEEKKCINNENNSSNNNTDNNFEIKLNSLKKIHDSLNIESDLIFLTKNNISENQNIFIEDLSNILIQRNKLLNELLTLFFTKTQELIEKEKKLNQLLNNTKNNISLTADPSSQKMNDFNRTFSNSKNKNKEIKFFFSARKYDNMVNYDNSVRNRLKNKSNQKNNKTYLSKRNTNKNSAKKTNLRNEYSYLSDFSKTTIINNKNNGNNLNNKILNYSTITIDDNRILTPKSYSNKKKYIIRNMSNPYVEKSHYLAKTGINSPKKNNRYKNKGRSSSVIKEFKNNYKLNENKNLEMKKGNLDNLVNWEKLNLDKLNEIGVNLLSGDNNNNIKK